MIIHYRFSRIETMEKNTIMDIYVECCKSARKRTHLICVTTLSIALSSGEKKGQIKQSAISKGVRGIKRASTYSGILCERT